ncbi:MAG: ATP-binding cassette domain-containing protein [Clostridiales Family XIII bacterium]|nr:ATP-binding cassette domain-containing protein [Clostridiales Family XIII bacterium]
MSELLRVEDLSIAFGNNQVLKGLSFEVNENEVLGIIGPNGAGKTVLLNILTGILKPDSGRIIYQGEDIAKTKIVERTYMGIGRTFQVPRSFEGMSVYENVMIGGVCGRQMTEKEAGAGADKILAQINMADKRDLLAGTLGLLDRKRLEIGVALASKPRLLLIDEAAGGLTESEVVSIIDIVRGAKEQGVTIIWIEHVLQTMIEGTDRTLCVAEGRNVICGNPRDVMDSPEVHAVYLGTEEDYADEGAGADNDIAKTGTAQALPPQDKTLLEISGLNVLHGDLQAIHDVSMRIERGHIVSIIGANGAGKSTLLNTVMGIHNPAGGTIVFEGDDITGKRTSAIAEKGLAMTPEGSRVFADMTVTENLLMGAYLPAAKKAKTEQLEKVFEMFPVLKEKSEQLASFLSGGQRQMLSIARAIMMNPKVVICDEISLGLAPVVIQDIYAKLKELNEQGLTFILVEQEIKRSLRHSDYSYVMVKGRIVLEGKSSELSRSDVSDAYFGINRFA